MRVYKKARLYSLTNELTGLEQTAVSLVQALGLNVFVADDAKETFMVNAAEFNTSLGMCKTKGIKGRFTTQLKHEVESNHNESWQSTGHADGTHLDKLSVFAAGKLPCFHSCFFYLSHPPSSFGNIFLRSSPL